MRRKSNELSLKDAIDMLMKQYRIDDRYRFEQVKSKWESIVGKLIAQRTEKLHLKNSILYITVNSSTLKQELNFLKVQIVKRVNEEAGKDLIREVVIF